MDPQEMVIPTGVRLALDRLDRAGYEAYIVGGCVRDSLLGETPTDWDLATSASPERIKEVFNGYNQIDTGIRHGTITVILDDMPIEITTYRVDGKYSDGRRPDEVHFTGDIVEDLARRDFTINACAMTESEVIDPFGGKDDLRHGIIRSVGDPKERFKEDALRILRGIRFASVLGFKVEEETKKAILDCRELIRNVSMERITMEFSKILLGDAVYDTLLEFQAVMAVVFPEIQEMVGFDQRNKYHIYDVYRHTLKSVESIDKDVALRTTMFFHDIAKPSCFTLDENGVGHFYGHAKASAVMAEGILERMRFPNRKIRDIVELIKYHDRPIGLTAKSVRKLLGKMGEEQFRRLLKVKRADTMAKNPNFQEEKLKDLEIIEGIAYSLIAEDACITRNQLAVNGNDLIELGIPQGRPIGRILDTLLEMVLNEELENNKADLLKQAKAIWVKSRL
ncbi:MAG: HD domain-containing protein [Clostridiales bacterium]|jgi:tRNA nucleotidyltransferase (CCA-adding enzyme)|nr:HD domain-containing protein [Clostridiales bacterium]